MVSKNKADQPRAKKQSWGSFRGVKKRATHSKPHQKRKGERHKNKGVLIPIRRASKLRVLIIWWLGGGLKIPPVAVLFLKFMGQSASVLF